MKIRKKMITTLLLTAVLTLGTVAGGVTTVKAAGNGDAGAQTAESAVGADTNVSKGNSGTQADATVAITKNLYMDATVATPTNYKFNFTATPVSVDGDTALTASTDKGKPGYMPTITISSIDTSATGTTPLATEYTTDGTSYAAWTTPVAGTKVVTYSTGDILTGFIADADHAGEYIYTITEASFDESSSNKTADTAAMEKSDAVYTMHIYVANKYDNPTDTADWVYVNAKTGLYIAGVGVFQTTDDAGTTPTTAPKVNANQDSGVTGEGSAFAFRNNYTPVASLRIEKQLQGAYADRTKLFAFETELTLPEIHNATITEYEATICNPDGSADTTQGTAGVIKFTDANSYKASYNLSDGMYLKFTENLPVGTTYTAVETTVTDYTLTATVKTADGSATDATPVAATITSGAISTPTFTSNTVGDTTLLATDKEPTGNHVLATNTYKAVTPTGILMNNLPFILMILVAIGGAVAYVVVKRRKSYR